MNLSLNRVSPTGDSRSTLVLRAALAIALAFTGACVRPDPSTSRQGPSPADLSTVDDGDEEATAAGGSSGDTGGSAAQGGTGGSAEQGGTGGSGGSLEPLCHEGDTRKCHVELATHEGVKSCFDGIEKCTDGVWGPCGGAL